MFGHSCAAGLFCCATQKSNTRLLGLRIDRQTQPLQCSAKTNCVLSLQGEQSGIIRFGVPLMFLVRTAEREHRHFVIFVPGEERRCEEGRGGVGRGGEGRGGEGRVMLLLLLLQQLQRSSSPGPRSYAQIVCL